MFTTTVQRSRNLLHLSLPSTYTWFVGSCFTTLVTQQEQKMFVFWQ
jgi:hypothetical protein